MNNTLLRTALHDWHASHRGRLVDFAGWSMPVQYSSIVAEHQATRRSVGMFDVSHMGRLLFRGDDPCGLLDHLLTRDVRAMKPGQVRYSLVTNQRGGILDDVLVYRLPAGEAARGDEVVPDDVEWMLVVNAGNRVKINDWIFSHRPESFGAAVQDVTERTAMIAVQGPRALEVVSPILDYDVAGLKYYQVARLPDLAGLVSRTGYTGEDGCELIVSATDAPALWERIVSDDRVEPAGLGARDTLRLEAAMPLYGHELDEQIDPFEAGLGFAVRRGKSEFVGREALSRAAEDEKRPRRVGLTLDGRRVPRQGYKVHRDGRTVGRVTSGTFSPTLDRPIAMAYVEPASAQTGLALEIDIRGRAEPARVVELPFYARS